MILGLDVSHHQGVIDFPAVKAASRDFIVIKATEGIGYTDPTFTANRKAAHAAGLIVGLYHFARDNSPAAEAAYFARVVGALQPGEFLVLDQEVTHASGNVPWCAAWLSAVHAQYGIAPLIYMNQGSGTGVASGNWTQIAKTNGLWLAKYDNAPTAQSTVPYWGTPAMKQYSDAGSVLGVAGTCDVNAFYGTRTQLLAYSKGGSPTPGDNMPTADEIAAAVWNYGVQHSAGDISAAPAWLWLRDGREDAATVKDAQAGYGARIERIDEGSAAGHGDWGYGARIEDIQAKVDQAQAPQVDAQALAAALLADPAGVDRLGAAIAAHLKLTSS